MYKFLHIQLHTLHFLTDITYDVLIFGGRKPDYSTRRKGSKHRRESTASAYLKYICVSSTPNLASVFWCIKVLFIHYLKRNNLFYEKPHHELMHLHFRDGQLFQDFILKRQNFARRYQFAQYAHQIFC